MSARATPLISLLTVCAPGQTPHPDTITSLLQQSLEAWEWLVVAPPEAKLPPDARIVRVQPHAPTHGALLNAAAARAQAPLLALLDPAAVLAPTALEQLAWLLWSDARPAFAAAHVVAGLGATRAAFDDRIAFLIAPPRLPLVLLRRTAYEQLGGWDAALGVGLAEADFWLRGATEGMWGRDVPLVLARLPAASHSDAVAQALRGHHAALYRTGLPPLPPADERPFAPLPLALPFSDLRSLRGEPGKRLLLLLPFLDVGGVSSFALAMLDQLVARGYSCTVATTLPGAHPLHDAFARRAEVWLLEHFLLRADFPRFLRYLIESRGIDTLLLSNSLLGYRLLPFFRSYCPDLTIIDYNHMRDPDTANGGGPGFGAAYDALLDMHLASSDELRGWMVAHGADPARSHVVYTSIDAARWRPNPEVRAAVRAELGLGDEPLVLYAARLTPQKQPQVFARVVARLAARGLSFRCIVAGDGPDARALARFLRRHQLTDRVRMLGSVDSERVQKLMAASDILFLPSAYEGLALVLFEALASGVVPVSVDSGGQRELVTPDCGVLVAPDAHQEERYAAALEWLIRAPRQREQMARMGRARVVESFSITTMGAQLDELIGQARQLACTAPRERVGQGAASVAASLAVEELRHYQRNHRFRAALRAWEWWKAYGSRYNRRCSAIKERVALRISIWKGCRFN